MADGATKTKTEVAILYNGETRRLRYHGHQKVKVLLDAAIREFGITTNQHLLSLFTATGTELADGETLETQGVRPGDELVLRPSVVKGG